MESSSKIFTLESEISLNLKTYQRSGTLGMKALQFCDIKYAAKLKLPRKTMRRYWRCFSWILHQVLQLEQFFYLYTTPCYQISTTSAVEEGGMVSRGFGGG